MHVLLLSNGHGEDLSGALLGQELIQHGVRVTAMPLVGRGGPYRSAGIPLAGCTHELSTGGLGYTNAWGQLREIWEGQLIHLWRQLRELRRQRRNVDLVVAIGDLVPVLGAWLSGQPAAAYLVAYSSHYEGRLRLPWPCGWLLRRRRFKALFSRDRLTAQDLTAQLGREVRFVGNPFFDLVAQNPAAQELRQGQRPTPRCLELVLLPGSRLPEAERNLALMLQVLERLAQLQAQEHLPARLQITAALVPALSAERVARVAQVQGWSSAAGGQAIQRGNLMVALRWQAFAASLRQADLVLSMAGTASEQAVGLALPVVQLAGTGPQFTAGFAEAQRRLLGPGVVCADGPATAASTLAQTARLCQQQLLQLADGQQREALTARLEQVAAERIGAAGGSGAMASAIMQLDSHSPAHA